MLTHPNPPMFECQVCRKVLPDLRKSINIPRKWCGGCRQEGLKRYKRDQRRAAGHGEIGASQPCRNCGDSFVRKHRRHFYCPPCSELSAKSALPEPRRVQLEYQKKRNRERRRTDPAFAISCRISAGINGSLKGGKAGRKWEGLVGYTLPDLMDHLEKQFLPGMGWKNRDRWDIDHIVPLAAHSFETTDDPEFAAAWALSNLRPLWKIDNIKKSARRTHLL